MTVQHVVLMAATFNRCHWALQSELLKEYHDNEWGKPLYNDLALFELLILEGHQAGLSWEIILKRREQLRAAYFNFDPNKLINLSDQDLENYRTDDRVIKNRLKINSIRENAKSYFKVLNEHSSFSSYLWSFVDNVPINNSWDKYELIPAKTDLSEKLSASLKKYGFKFVGPTIIYSFMQASGMINDHLNQCNFK